MLDQDGRNDCGPVIVTLTSPYMFLSQYSPTKIVTLTPLESDEEGLYEEAYLEYTLDGLSL